MQTESQPKSGGSKAWIVIVIVAIVLIALGAGGYFYYKNRNTKTVKSGDYELKTGENISKPKAFPANMALYPKATCESFTTDPAAGSSYVCTTADSPETIIAWFKTQVAKDGWNIDAQTPMLISVSNADSMGNIAITQSEGENSITFAAVPKSSLSADEQSAIQGSQELLNKMQGE